MNEVPPLYALRWLEKMLDADMDAALRCRADYGKSGDDKTSLYYAGKMWGLHKAREYVRAAMEGRHD